jgi:hypothetical protein
MYLKVYGSFACCSTFISTFPLLLHKNGIHIQNRSCPTPYRIFVVILLLHLTLYKFGRLSGTVKWLWINPFHLINLYQMQRLGVCWTGWWVDMDKEWTRKCLRPISRY